MHSHSKRFILFSSIGLFLLFVVLYLSLSLGSRVFSISELFEGLFRNTNIYNSKIIKDIRLPRFIADIIVGASLAIAGAIMQGTTKNPMADSGIMGISSGSTLGIVIVVTFIPNAGRFEKMGIAALGAFLATSLIYIIAFVGKGRLSTDRMVLTGMAISTFLSSLITAIILKNGLSNLMLRYTSGSSANIIWKDIYLALPIFLIGVMISFIISRGLTIMNLGEDVSKGLGANVKVLRILSTVVVLILSAVAVCIIGPVSYVGLMIPYIARRMVGSDYRFVLPISFIYGALFVSICDLLVRSIKPGYELPIGLLITIIGVPFFIYTSRKYEE
jgi:iron complex transport system permease protein